MLLDVDALVFLIQLRCSSEYLMCAVLIKHSLCIIPVRQTCPVRMRGRDVHQEWEHVGPMRPNKKKMWDQVFYMGQI